MLAASLSAQQGNVTSGNPVFPGWYADPEGIVFDDTYWIYPTVSMLHGEDTLTYRKEARRKTRAINPDYNQQTHLDAFSSKDLVHWTKHPSVLSIENVKWVEYAMWAPSIIRANGKYYLFFGGNDIQSDNEYGGIVVAVADRPKDRSRTRWGNRSSRSSSTGHSPSTSSYSATTTDSITCTTAGGATAMSSG